MWERMIFLVSFVLVLEFTVGVFANVTMSERFYSNNEDVSGASTSLDTITSLKTDQPVSYPMLRRMLFDFGPEVYYYEYKEPGVMEQDGVFYGLRLGYTDRSWITTSPYAAPMGGGMMFRVEGRLAFGQVDYDGGIIDLNTNQVTPYSMDDIDDWVFEGRFLLGADWLRRSALSTVYAGIGYRYLNDDTSSYTAGYERESNYLYIPVGYQFDNNQIMGWSFGFGAEFDIFIAGNQRSYLSDVSPTYWDVDMHQDSGYGYRASVKIQHKSESEIFIVEPFIRYWDIDDSEFEYVSFGTVWEPANETTEYGLTVLWMF